MYLKIWIMAALSAASASVATSQLSGDYVAAFAVGISVGFALLMIGNVIWESNKHR